MPRHAVENHSVGLKAEWRLPRRRVIRQRAAKIVRHRRQRTVGINRDGGQAEVAAEPADADQVIDGVDARLICAVIRAQHQSAAAALQVLVIILREQFAFAVISAAPVGRNDAPVANQVAAGALVEPIGDGLPVGGVIIRSGREIIDPNLIVGIRLHERGHLAVGTQVDPGRIRPGPRKRLIKIVAVPVVTAGDIHEENRLLRQHHRHRGRRQIVALHEIHFRRRHARDVGDGSHGHGRCAGNERRCRMSRQRAEAGHDALSAAAPTALTRGSRDEIHRGGQHVGYEDSRGRTRTFVRHRHGECQVAADHHRVRRGAEVQRQIRSELHRQVRHLAGDGAVIIRDHHVVTACRRRLHIGKCQRGVGRADVATVLAPSIIQRRCAHGGDAETRVVTDVNDLLLRLMRDRRRAVGQRTEVTDQRADRRVAIAVTAIHGEINRGAGHNIRLQIERTSIARVPPRLVVATHCHLHVTAVARQELAEHMDQSGGRRGPA